MYENIIIYMYNYYCKWKREREGGQRRFCDDGIKNRSNIARGFSAVAQQVGQCFRNE